MKKKEADFLNVSVFLLNLCHHVPPGMTGKTFSVSFFFLGYYGIQIFDMADNIFLGLLNLRVIGGYVGVCCLRLFLPAVA